MSVFANKCVAYGTLKRLSSLTLTVHHQLPLKEWISSVVHLVSASPLELLQIYSTGAFFESPMTDDLWKQLIQAHGKRLVRFSVHRMLISLQAIRRICIHCTNLRQLFVVVEPSSLVRFSLTLCQSIRAVPFCTEYLASRASVGRSIRLPRVCREAADNPHQLSYGSDRGRPSNLAS